MIGPTVPKSLHPVLENILHLAETTEQPVSEIVRANLVVDPYAPKAPFHRAMDDHERAKWQSLQSTMRPYEGPVQQSEAGTDGGSVMPLPAVVCDYPAIRAADVQEALRTATNEQILRETKQARKGFPERECLPKATISGRLTPEEPLPDQPHVVQSAMKTVTDPKAPIFVLPFRKNVG